MRLSPGVRIGPYEVLATLGTGGMAEVYRARDTRLGRDIALKLCATCHVVAEDQESAPLLKPPAPSFAEIAARPATNEASLREFLGKPHSEARRTSKMPLFTLGEFQIAPLVAYIESLRPPSK